MHGASVQPVRAAGAGGHSPGGRRSSGQAGIEEPTVRVQAPVQFLVLLPILPKRFSLLPIRQSDSPNSHICISAPRTPVRRRYRPPIDSATRSVAAELRSVHSTECVQCPQI